jgi:cobalamin biosynthesis protein CobD/CbiB
VSEFERRIRRQRERDRDRQRADRAVGAFAAWIVVGIIALVVAIWVFESAALGIIAGAIIAIAILWMVLKRSQR